MVSGDVLSQEEVESLLNSMSQDEAAAIGATGADGDSSSNFDKPKARSGATGILANISSPEIRGRPREKVTPYDFKRPERVGKDQMRALQTMHEGFGRNFGAGLSALLRTMVEVQLVSVDQLTYSEFVFSLENPTCFNLLRAAPLEGNLILDISPTILYPIIDRMLGGGKEPSPLARRPLTEIERRLVARITTLFTNEMKNAWENVLDLDIEVIRVESNPQLVQIVPPNEVVVLIIFELTIGDIRGMVNLCIPYNSIERIGNKLTADSWIAYGKSQATEETIAQITHSISSSLVELQVQLARTKIDVSDLIGLRIGDCIVTDKDCHSPVVVSIQGRPKFHGVPRIYKGHLAVEINQPIENPNEASAER